MKDIMTDTQLNAFMLSHEDFIRDLTLVGVSVVGFLVLKWSITEGWKLFKNTQRGRAMRQDREKTQAQYWADKLLTASLDAPDEGVDMTASEALDWFRRFGNLVPLTDLLPRGQDMLKDRLMKEKEVRGQTASASTVLASIFP